MSTPEVVKDNNYAIIFEKETEPKLTQVIAGTRIQTADGAAFRLLNFIGQPWAAKIEAFNKPGKFQRALKPKSTLITETLARKTQILYAMDNSAILLKLNLLPGSVVVEAGTGSGSLSCAISETIQHGHLFTFEFNQQRAQITKQFFQDLGLTNVTSTWRDVVSEGFAVEGVEVQADALFLDVPNPWAAIHHTKRAIKKCTD